MPEPPLILGTFDHHDEISLERALHAVLTLRGKRKKDAPGAEWFVTTSSEIEALVKMVLGLSGPRPFATEKLAQPPSEMG